MAEPESPDFNLSELDQLKKDMDVLEDQLTGTRGAVRGVTTEGPSASVEQVLSEFYRFGDLKLREKLAFFERPFSDFRKSLAVFPGQVILAPTQRVKNVTVKSFVGRQLILDEEGFRLFAKVGGFARWINNRVTVDMVREIPRSVDGSSGQVEFDGTVVITGSVGKGAKIKATGDVYVLADVDGGVISAGGSIFIYNGVLRRSSLFAEGSIFCGFLERAEASTKRDLWVKNAITHSRIQASGKLVVFDPKQAGFLSGSATVGRELNAAQIGIEGQRVDIAIKPEVYRERIQDFKVWLDEILPLAKESQNVADMFAIEAQPVAEFLLKESESPSLTRLAYSKKMSKGVKLTIGTVTMDTLREEGAGTWKIDGDKLKKDPYEAPEYTESLTRQYWRSSAQPESSAEVLAKLRRNVILTHKDSSKIGLIRALLGRPPGDNVFSVAAGKTLEDRPAELVRLVLKEPGDDDEKLKVFFDVDPPQRRVKVTCDEIKKGLEAASSKLDVPTHELSFDVIQEKSEGVMGLNKRPYILEIYRKPLTRDDMAKVTLPTIRVAGAAGAAAAAVKKSEGYYTIENTPDGLFLTVYPAEGENAKGVDVRVLLADIKARGYSQGVSEAVVRTVVEESKAERIRLADRQPEVKLDGKTEITVTPDKLKAILTVTAPKEGGVPATADDVMRKVGEMGIQKVDAETVAAYVEGGAFHDSLVIAEGTSAVDGEDARLEFLFKGAEGEEKEELEEDSTGRVDYRTMSAFKGVKEGQLLVKKYPPTEGSIGVDVFGAESRPKAGKDQTLTAGKNVQVSPDGTEFFAVTSGHVVMSGKTIRLDNILEHKGNVNYEIGNITFDGTVIIHGAVEEGFVVKATGDVFVESIARGFVESGGNIVVEKGIIGTPDTYVRAAGDITAKFVENANLFSEGNVLVAEALLHSIISARHNVVLREGKRSVVLGGIVRAGGSVEARTIGTDVATKTVIEVGYDPTVRSRIIGIEKEVDVNRKNFESVKQGIETLNKLKEKYGALPPEKEELLKKLVSTARGVAEKIRQLQRELLDLNRRLADAKPGIICARDKVLPGAVLTIMNYTMQIDKPYSFVRFYLDQSSDDIRFSEFKEIDI